MQFEKWVTVNISKGHAKTVDLGRLFEGDINALKMGAIIVDDSGDVSITGDVVGRAITPDGRVITPLDAGQDGNRGWVIISQDIINVSGRFEVFLRITDSNSTAVTVYGYGYCQQTSVSGTPINPGTPIPNVEELTSAASNCQGAANAALAVVDEIEEIAEEWLTATVDGTTLVLSHPTE